MQTQDLEAFFSRHKRVMLQFSAGKDSAACLWLLEPFWDKLDVVWMNPGNPYRETLVYMQEIHNAVPNFICIMGNQPVDIRKHGWPVDIVPMENTAFGQFAQGKEALRLRPFWECCDANMWRPLQEFVLQGNYSAVIRGQKHCDGLKNPMPSGTVVDGIEYCYPIDGWTNEQVLGFLGDERMPQSYKRGLRSSLDCVNCTAYTNENPGRIGDLEKSEPEAWKQVSIVHMYLVDSMAKHSEALRSCHGNPTAL